MGTKNQIRFRPFVEVLERRELLDAQLHTLVWDPVAPTPFDWERKENWLDETDPQNPTRADHYPGQAGVAGTDIAEFNGTNTSNCGVHVPVTIGALVILDGYQTVKGANPGDQNVQGTIFLNQTITVT